ncbi:MAG: NUDIX hydrolase [Verrucomicrobia bacterium]|nr:NUDIX hydrolase [Verrucomicrobiota bacterium]
MPLTRWKKLSTRDIIRERWVRLRADRVELAPGHILDPYYVLEEHEWVHVVALNAERQVLLVRQYRYAGDVFTWELPGGLADDPTEDLLVAAQRELREETGATAPRWRHIASPFPCPGRQNNRVHAYLAEDAAVTDAPHLDPSEAIESAWHSIPAMLDLIRRGEFQQANHIALFYLTLDTLGLLTHRAP